MARFFAPDQETPTATGDRWKVGDVVALQHAQDVGLVYAFEITAVNCDGSLPGGPECTRIVSNPEAAFGPELVSFRLRSSLAA